ncbi:MAG: hypothetical protein EON59_15840 [Alphaproteobacteria bacterium]|nr:MAG: hypothetical protein EON59_15840 [Alphaproteobacteria bacterium]
MRRTHNGDAVEEEAIPLRGGGTHNVCINERDMAVRRTLRFVVALVLKSVQRLGKIVIRHDAAFARFLAVNGGVVRCRCG